MEEVLLRGGGDQVIEDAVRDDVPGKQSDVMENAYVIA